MKHANTTIVRSKFGLSRHVPFMPGEDPRERHRRRHANALKNRATIEAWCEFRGVSLRVARSNHPETSAPEGWKWDFRVPGKFAQWRPFVGKLSYKTNLQDPVMHVVKVYDFEQLLTALEHWLADLVMP